MSAVQEQCLVSEPKAGAEYMPVFDNLPEDVRALLSASRINICTACFSDKLMSMRINRGDKDWDSAPCQVEEARKLIAAFEAAFLHDDSHPLAKITGDA